MEPAELTVVALCVIGMCVYKGSFYRQGDRWTDGCDKSCVCDDAANQRYTCRERLDNLMYFLQGCCNPLMSEETLYSMICSSVGPSNA